MIYRVDQSPIHGLGLFTERHLPAETMIGHFEGMLVPFHENMDETHVLWLDDEQTYGVQVTNHFRYLNHSTEPNVGIYGIEIWTERDIFIGEELTFDYGWDDDE